MRTKEEKETFTLHVIILCDLEPCEYSIYFLKNKINVYCGPYSKKSGFGSPHLIVLRSPDHPGGLQAARVEYT